MTDSIIKSEDSKKRIIDKKSTESSSSGNSKNLNSQKDPNQKSTDNCTVYENKSFREDYPQNDSTWVEITKNLESKWDDEFYEHTENVDTGVNVWDKTKNSDKKNRPKSWAVGDFYNQKKKNSVTWEDERPASEINLSDLNNKFSSTFIDNITKLAQYQSQSQISTFTDHSLELISEENIGLTEHQNELYCKLLNILTNLTDCYYDATNIDEVNELKEFLKTHKNDPDLKAIINSKTAELDNTILHKFSNLNSDILDLLLNAGADPNIQDKDGKTPLHYMVDHVSGSNASDKQIEILLKYGAKTDIQDYDRKRIPLHYAADHGCTSAIELLTKDEINKGGINIQDNEGNTPLHLAALHYDYATELESLDLLLKVGADPNIQDENGKTPLHYMFDYDNYTKDDQIRILLKYGARVDIQDGKKNDNEATKNTPLHYAADSGYVSGMELLVKDDINQGAINIQNKEGNTPLHLALHNKETGVAECILTNKGISINTDIKNNKGLTPLLTAASLSNVEMVEKILDRKFENKGISINLDIKNKQELKSLLTTALLKGVNLGIKNKQEITSSLTDIALNYSAIVEKILDKTLKNKRIDTNLEIKDKQELTALLATTALSDKEEMKKILDKILKDKEVNINLGIQNREELVALVDVARSITDLNDNEKIKKKILDQVQLIHTDKDKDCYGNNVLHYAAFNRFTGDNLKTTKCDFISPDNDPLNSSSNDYSEDTAIKSVISLIDHGIDVNVKNKDGNTPIFFAIEDFKPEVARTLLEKGADINIRDKNGYTALHYAIKTKSLKMLLKLLPHKMDNYGVEVMNIEKVEKLISGAIDNEGNTLLHHAVKLGCDRGMLKFLIEHGVNIDAKNKNGVAPIHIAAKYGNEHLIDFFLENKADINSECGNFVKSEINVVEQNFINIKGDNIAKSSINITNIDLENNVISYKKATPILIATDSNHDNAVTQFLSRGAKSNIANKKGLTPLYIAIKKVYDKSCTEEEREIAYNIIEKLAPFSDILTPLYIAIKKVYDKSCTEEEREIAYHTIEKLAPFSDIMNDERIIDIIEQVIRGKSCNNLPNAPFDEFAPSAPVDYSFYDQVGSYVREIPNLYPDLSKELSEMDAIGEVKDLQNVLPINAAPQSDYKNLNNTPEKIKFNKEINEILSGIKEAQNLDKLEKVLNQVLKSRIKLGGEGDLLMDLIMKKILELNCLEKNHKAASNIICKLLERGANIFYGKIYEEINNQLGVKFKNHKANALKAISQYSELNKDFYKIAKNAILNSDFISAEVNNKTFYIECSKDSIVEVAQIVDEAKNLKLFKGSIKCGDSVIKIGTNELKIQTANGSRNYADISDSGDFILTFNTSLGELGIRLYRDTQNKNIVKIEIDNQEKVNQLMNKKEEIGKNCRLGGLAVLNAIKQGYFERMEKSQCFTEKNCSDAKHQKESKSICDQKEISVGVKNTDCTSVKKGNKGYWQNKVAEETKPESCRSH